MQIFFINYHDYSEDVLRDYYDSFHEERNDIVWIFRGNGYHFNYDIIREAKEREKKEGRETIVYTNDETMLHFAQYDNENKEFLVHIIDEYTEGEFIPLKQRRPNLRYINNLVTMQQKGLFNYEECIDDNN